MKQKLFKILLAVVLITLPFGAGAVGLGNYVSINGIVSFQLNTIDLVPVATTILASPGGLVTNLDVQANYIDITLDNLSTITFNATVPGQYLKITPALGVDFTATPSCITTTVTLNGIGATTVVRLEVISTAPSCLSSLGGGTSVAIFPTNYSVTINNNLAQTNSVDVILNLTAQNAVSVIISNDPNFIGAGWEAFTNPTDKAWTLLPGDGTKTVYAIYKSSDGNIGSIVNDSIILSSVIIVPPVEPPVVTPVVPPTTPLSTGNYSANEAINLSSSISGDKGLIPLPDSVIPPCVADSLIKLADDHDPLTQADSSVYYCGVDGKRYVFPNSSTYFSWYPNFNNILIISAEAMAAILLGQNVTIKPGTRLVKFMTDPKVYAVAPDGTLRWVVDEATVVALYGSDWNKWVIDISDAFYANYNFGDKITLDLVTPGSTLPPSGLLVI